jgi:hypothetical protein
LLPRALHGSPALQCPGTPGATKCPEPLCMSEVLPRSSWSRRPTSAGVPPPSLLLRAHAPILTPPRASVVPSTPGLCRLLSAPAGRRTFPTFSLRILPCVLGPLPRLRVECLYPLLPPRHRPAPRSDQVGASQSPYSDCSTAPFSRLQSLLDGQAHRCARHPDRSYRYGSHRRAAVTLPSEPLVGRYLPTPRICLPSESGN